MKNVGRVTFIAVVFIVVLRLAIGWQLFYEGIWKVKTLSSPKPWTAAGYLKNSQGPMRGAFRNMAGDPDDLDWLDSDKVIARWRDWKTRFAAHYKLDEKQLGSLNRILDGPSQFTHPLESGVPESVDLTSLKVRIPGEKEAVQIVTYDEAEKRLRVDGRARLTPRDQLKLLSTLPEEDLTETDSAFKAAIEKLYKDSSRLSYTQRVRAQLTGNPENAGVKAQQKIGEIEKYKMMLADYEKGLASAKQDYQYDHLQKLWGDIQSQKSSLVGPVRALESDMKKEATKVLSVSQLKMGSVPEPWTSLRISDMLTILGLTALGLLLIIGLFTRFSALMAAIMLFSFYLAMPPLPGYPEVPGPEHSLVVNKNLIEVIALLAIAALPSGLWFGLDSFIAWFFADKD